MKENKSDEKLDNRIEWLKNQIKDLGWAGTYRVFFETELNLLESHKQLREALKVAKDMSIGWPKTREVTNDALTASEKVLENL